jgi:hypothetical protein
MTNATVTVLDEFNEVIDGIVGLYFDASRGFSIIREQQEQHLLTLRSVGQYNPANPPAFFYANGDPHDPHSVVYHVTPIETLVTRNEERGPNRAFLGRSILVTIFSYWEDHYRQQLATNLGCEKNDVSGDIWGDMRWLRQAIIHHRSIATRDVEKCKILRWFKESDEITLYDDHIKSMIIAIRNYFDSVLTKIGVVSPTYSGRRDPGGHIII